MLQVVRKEYTDAKPVNALLQPAMLGLMIPAGDFKKHLNRVCTCPSLFCTDDDELATGNSFLSP